MSAAVELGVALPRATAARRSLRFIGISTLRVIARAAPGQPGTHDPGTALDHAPASNGRFGLDRKLTRAASHHPSDGVAAVQPRGELI